MNTVRVIAFAISFLLFVGDRSVGDAYNLETLAKPTEIFQGDILELKIPGEGLTTVQGRMGKVTIPFYPNGHGFFTALVGVDLEARPGLATVEVKSTTGVGILRETPIRLKIKPKLFKQESFSVASQFDQLSAPVLQRIKQERDQFSRAFTSSAAKRLWEGSFLLPVSSDVTSPFGYRRVINGTPRSPHTGVDLKAPLGTEVVAANHGRVILLGDFFYSGNSVVLDHGAGLYTVYFHLSELKVEPGAPVKKGDVIALSGMSGRVTGPHLHWGARLNNARVDPFELLRKFSDH